LRTAARRGLGPLDPAGIEVLGNAPEGKFKLPVTLHRLSFIGRAVNQRFFRPLSKSKLRLDRMKCKQCKLCVEGCPTGAMSFDEYPRIDEEKCIRCLCCQELCPETAWEAMGLLRSYLFARRS
jgi:ferredoxin